VSPRRFVDLLPELATHVASAGLIGLVLVAVGQPIVTDDLWWHLGLGQLYATAGPWLDRDPFLFAAEHVPEPASWLGAVAFHWIAEWGGFQGLRVAHVSMVATTLAVGWSMLRRASGSRLFASIGTSALAALSAYRFFQLRPHLFTILLTLIVMRLLVLDRRPPTPKRIGVVMVLLALWANLHGAFVVGLALLFAVALAAVVVAAWAPRSGPDPWARARGLTVAAVLGLLATFLNPAGPRFLALYFTAGVDTPDLAIVADEWAPVRLLSLPMPNVPPTPLSWALVWSLVILTPALLGAAWWIGRGSHVRTSDREPAPTRSAAGPIDSVPDDASDSTPIDAVEVALAGVSLVGVLSAVRLLWLGFFPLLAIGSAVRVLTSATRSVWLRRLGSIGAAGLATTLLLGFIACGDWPMISRGLQASTYAMPYSTAKYHGHGVWFLSDAGIEGRVYNEYWIGNFLGYWLEGQVELIVNGSLNVPKDVMSASQVIRYLGRDEQGRTAPELLDLYGIDVFFGTGFPIQPPVGRPPPDTTRLMESIPGWILIFRNMQTAIYVRDSEAGRRNLDRAAAYYAAQSVPFDPTTGFDPRTVLGLAPAWAVAHGMAPSDYRRLKRDLDSADPARRRSAREGMASVYALLGLYDEAIALDQRIVAGSRRAIEASRRLVWSLMHAGRIDDLAAAADRLDEIADPRDFISSRIVNAARASATASNEERAAILADLPLFSRPQGQRVAAGFVAADPRPSRR